MSAPISCSVVNRPVRSGFIITPSKITSEPGTISAATIGKAADDGSAGTVTRAGCKLGLAHEGDAAAVVAVWLDPHAGAEMAEHAFGVVARRLLLDHRGLARRRQPGEQHGGLELRRRDRRLVDDRDRVARALQPQRQASAIGGIERAGAHALERIEHAAHRPRAQRGVAVELSP